MLDIKKWLAGSVAGCQYRRNHLKFVLDLRSTQVGMIHKDRIYLGIVRIELTNKSEKNITECQLKIKFPIRIGLNSGQIVCLTVPHCLFLHKLFA